MTERMADYWTVDLRHFLESSGALAALPGRGMRLGQYWAEIVSQATLYDDPTTLRCRRRPGRRPCGALLTIFFDAENHDVLWFCPTCRDGGRISGWQGTFWDHDGGTETPA
jgi:hypothetical protein